MWTSRVSCIAQSPVADSDDSPTGCGTDAIICGGSSFMTHALRSGRRLATVLLSIGLAAIVATGSVLAGTPVTEGYRDHAYGGGATRPSGDKPQSKLWYTDEGGGAVQWWAGMFRYSVSPALAEFRIYKLSADKSTWSPTTIFVDRRDASHGDYLWDEATNTLYVASVPIPNSSAPFAVPSTPDDVRIFQYTYDPATDTYTQVGGIRSIPGTASTASPEFRGGAWTVTIDKDSTGRLWVAWPKNTQVMYSYSDDGVTWSAAAQVPVQAANPINFETLSRSDSAAVITFGNGAKDTIGIMWSDQDNSGATAGEDNGYYFATLAAGSDPTVAGNWTLVELPKLSGLTTNEADNHINLKTTSDGTVYMVGKARTDTINCATNQNRALTPFFRRTPAGTWTTYLVGTVGDCDTRPQVVISEEIDTAYVFLTSPNGGGTIYRKSAPITGPDAFVFRGVADTTIQRGVPFVKSATDTLIDDASTTKQVVTAASGIAVIANNLTSSTSSNTKVYLHNWMPLPATDNTAPSGTVSINGGAASTSSQAATVSVPATDAGSGMSLVKVSNNSDMSSSSTFVYTTPIAWTLTPGVGTKTVYVQWRDAAGNWSSTASDTIELTDDVTAPTPPGPVAHTIFGSGRFGIPVRLTWTAGTDPGGSGVQGYRVTKSVNGGAFTEVTPMTTALGISLDLPNSAITYRFCVYTIDNRNNTSGPRCSATFTTRSYSESNANIRYTGTWTLSSSTVYVGGKAKVSSARNATATLGFRGNRVGWYARLGPAYGQARVYIDGALVKTVNLNAATIFDRKLVYTKSWTSVGNHSIRIVVVGTSGHPKVVLDQIFVLQ